VTNEKIIPVFWIKWAISYRYCLAKSTEVTEKNYYATAQYP
jgi:hypothetical protein